jgi:Abnormal spindle-like microcephaly-assoc'd, ASPM-SPD-2-Hydin
VCLRGQGDVGSGGFNEMNPVSTFPSCNAAMNAGTNFVSEINASGALAFSTCPGSSLSSAVSMALDSSGDVYVAGPGFPALPPMNPIQSNSGNGEPYIVEINPNTSSVVFASFVGGAQSNESDTINDIAVDSAGNIYAAGFDGADVPIPAPFPVFNALQPLSGGFSSCSDNPCGHGNDAIFLKIAPTDAPAAALTPAALTFPAQAVGVASTPMPVTIFDLGSAALTVSNATATGDFSVQQPCGTVAAAGGTCPVQVTFTPTAAGTRTGTLTITDNSAGSPRTVALTGVGGQQSVSVTPATLSFSQAVNTTGTSVVTVGNSGTLPLQISTVQVSGAAFSETNGCGVSVGVGQSCGINVSFSPTALGNATGTLTITDSAAGSPQTVPLTGTGVADNIGLVYPPNTGPSTVTVAAGSVAITNIQVGGAGVGGMVTLSCSGLPQGASCTFSPSSPLQIYPTTSREVNLTISTTARSQLFTPIVLTTGLTLLALCLSILFFRNTSTITAPRLRWRFVPALALAICACGGGNSSSPNGGGGSSNGTPAGGHVITITATQGSATQTLLFNLVVQ